MRVSGKLIGLVDNKLKGYALCSEYVEIELPISEEDIREAVARAYNVSVGELPALEQSVCEAVISLLTEGKPNANEVLKSANLADKGKGEEKVVDKKQTADIKHWDFLCPFCNYRIMIKTDRCPQCNYVLNSKPKEKKEQPEKSCQNCGWYKNLYAHLGDEGKGEECHFHNFDDNNKCIKCGHVLGSSQKEELKKEQPEKIDVENIEVVDIGRENTGTDCQDCKYFNNEFSLTECSSKKCVYNSNFRPKEQEKSCGIFGKESVIDPEKLNDLLKTLAPSLGKFERNFCAYKIAQHENEIFRYKQKFEPKEKKEVEPDWDKIKQHSLSDGSLESDYCFAELVDIVKEIWRRK